MKRVFILTIAFFAFMAYLFMPSDVFAIVNVSQPANVGQIINSTRTTIPGGYNLIHISGYVPFSTTSGSNNTAPSWPVYYDVALCTDNGQKFNDYYSNNNRSPFTVIETKTACNIYGLDYPGRIIHISGWAPTSTISLEDQSAYFIADVRINFDQSGSYQLVYEKFSTIPFYFDPVTESNVSIIGQTTDEIKQGIDDLNDTLTDSSIEGAESSGDSFFGDYQDKDYGLSDIITLPLSFIQGLTNSTCSNLTLPLPFVNQNLTLPCMSLIYSEHFGAIYTIYQTVTTALIGYWVAVRIYGLVKDFKDPENDKIEVMDL